MAKVRVDQLIEMVNSDGDEGEFHIRAINRVDSTAWGWFRMKDPITGIFSEPMAFCCVFEETPDDEQYPRLFAAVVEFEDGD